MPAQATSPSRRRRPADGSFTSIGSGAILRGRLTGAGLAVVHGRLEGGGDWYGELLVAGDGRLVATSGLRARRLRIEGRAEGEMEATELLEVVAGSRLAGDVRAADARIEPGARPTARMSLGAVSPDPRRPA